MNGWITVLFAFVASGAFSVLMHIPRKALVPAAVLGTAGFLVQGHMESAGIWIPAGYLLAAVLVSFAGEGLARGFRMPATVFVMPGAVPLVPGFRLVQTMQAFVDGQLGNAGALGAETILCFAAVAMGVALTTLLVRVLVALTGKDRRSGRLPESEKQDKHPL